jgi:hypothetical protein
LRSSALAATSKAHTVNGQPSTSDTTSTLTARHGVRSSWDAEPRPSGLTGNGVTETSGDDGDSARIARTVGRVTMMNTQGLWEDTIGISAKRRYRFDGELIGQHDTWSGETANYVSSDHPGSVSRLTGQDGAFYAQQRGDPPRSKPRSSGNEAHWRELAAGAEATRRCAAGRAA